MIDYKADVLWLCEVGHHTDGLRGSKYTPKEMLLESGEASRLMEHKDQFHIVDNIGSLLDGGAEEQRHRCEGL